MILRTFVIILLFKIINAKINIDITTSYNTSDNTTIDVNFSGYDSNIITDEEKELFGINDDAIFDAVKNYYGTKPKNVYLKSPTPWGDLYKTYLWEQVTRILSVKSATVKKVMRDPVEVLSQNFDNSSNFTIKVNTGMSQEVENIISTSWTRSSEIAVSQEMEYGINVFFAKASGKTGISYTSIWGKSEEKSQAITIGTTAGMETELKPGQSARAVLSAQRGYLEVKVTYVATLRGYLAVNFKRKVSGHHFWFPSIDAVMKSAGLSNEKTAVEIIKVGYYTDASLTVYDKESGLPI